MIDLWKNISKDVIKGIINKLQESHEENRKLAASQRLLIYFDAWREMLDTEMANQFHPQNYKRIRLLLDITDNLLKKTVDLISQVYSDPVTRTYGDNKDFDASIFFGGETNQDVFWERVNTYTELLNDLIIIPAWDEELQMIRPIILTPDITQVIQKVSNPEKIVSFWYTVEYADTMHNNDQLIYFWSLVNNFVLDGRKGFQPIEIESNPENINPYKDAKNNPVLPAVYVHKKQIPGSFWNPTTGDDLFTGTIATGVKRTSKNYLFKVNSFKQPVITGLDDQTAPELIFDPLSALLLEPAGTASVLDYTADFGALSQNIKDDTNALLGSYGLKADDFKATPESGKALTIKNSALLKIRRKQIPYCRKAETDYHEMSKIVWKHHTKNTITEEIKLDYPEIEMIDDPREQLEHDKQKVKDLILNIADFYMKHNPDIKTRKEAMKKVEENAKALKAIDDAGLSINRILDKTEEILK